ncbi:hypothetical protein IWX63_003363 [Arthrobacter sp. CAN_A2]|uniref:hypothetical protein n=1 Tax=Arthrobacter sp. CAN_A2 TaxID=2787718 RepID=UPI0018EFAA08
MSGVVGPVSSFLPWVALIVAVSISVLAGWAGLDGAAGEIGPRRADGGPAEVEFWAPVGWAAMLAVVPVMVAAWRSARWAAISLAGATGVQVLVAMVVIGRYAGSDVISGGLEGLIFLLPLTLGVVGAVGSFTAVLIRRRWFQG